MTNGKPFLLPRGDSVHSARRAAPCDSSTPWLGMAMTLLLLATQVSLWAQPNVQQIPEGPAKHLRDSLGGISTGTVLAGLSLGYVFLLAIPIAALVAIVTVTRPSLSERLREIVAHQRAVAFWWGLATTVLCLFGFAVFANHAAYLSIVILVVYAWCLLVGFAGAAREAGHLLLGGKTCCADNPALTAAAGSLLLCAACLIPVFGQLLGIYLACVSVGGFRLGWRTRVPHLEQEPPSAVPASP